MTRNMVKINSSLPLIAIHDLLAADSLLSIQKEGALFFSVEKMATPSQPISDGLHIIKSEYFAEIFIEQAKRQNITQAFVVCDSKSKVLLRDQAYISTLISSTNIELSLTRISKVFHDQKFKDINNQLDGRISGTAKIHPTALVSPLAFIGEYSSVGAYTEIMPHSFVGAKTVLGDYCTLFSGVRVYPFVKLGDRCRVHAGVVIGADGFGYVYDQGKHQKIWHIGGVVIGNDVEIGANSCVDAGTFVPTTIGDGCIIDNLVQIGHNTQLGRGVILCGQAGTGGSSKAGDFAVFGGKSALGPHCEVGKFTKVAGGGMVTKNWGESLELAGHPARPLKEWLKNLANVNKLAKEMPK